MAITAAKMKAKCKGKNWVHAYASSGPPTYPQATATAYKLVAKALFSLPDASQQDGLRADPDPDRASAIEEAQRGERPKRVREGEQSDRASVASERNRQHVLGRKSPYERPHG